MILFHSLSPHKYTHTCTYINYRTQFKHVVDVLYYYVLPGDTNSVTFLCA